MSKRAEEATLKAYPHFTSENIDEVTLARKLFRKGYEQAEKYLILRTKKWIKEIYWVCDITDEHGYRIELRDLIASFEKSMEEEK